MSDIFPWLTKEQHEQSVHLNLISRINSLELINLELAAKLQVAQARIDELERPLCIGETTIRILAKEGAKVFEDGRALVAADELFAQDPYERIAKLEAALREVLDCIDDPYNDLAIQIGKALEKGDE